QLVNFHLLFNLTLVICGLPFVVPLANLVKALITEQEIPEKEYHKPQSALDYNVLENAELALASATRELLRMSEQIEIMFNPLMNFFDTSTPDQIKAIREMDETINQTHTEIKLYLAKLNQQQLSKEQALRSKELVNFAISMERVGDIICKDLLRLCETKHKRNLHFSEAGRKELTNLHSRVMTNMQLALNVLISEDLDSAKQLFDEKQAMRKLEQKSRDSHMQRLGKGNAESINTSDIHLEVIQGIKEINSRFISFSYPILAKYGMLMKGSGQKN
ncbi:MAG: PhoU domain-containing protein, partial [Pseudomonadota bacterium]